MRVDVSFLPVLAAAFLLTFARVGTMVMLLPGVGELNLPSRVRLTIALVLTAILLPAHQKAYTVELTALAPVLTMLFQEIVIGAVLGLTARLAISALQVAGSVIAQQLGLGFVTAVDPSQNQQGVLVGNFLTVLGITLIFATDLHHLVIAAINTATRSSSPARCRWSATRRSTSPASWRPRSASAFSFRRRSWCSDCCSISASACCRG
jgi:flagellar biosynthetic protein FliR